MARREAFARAYGRVDVSTGHGVRVKETRSEIDEKIEDARVMSPRNVRRLGLFLNFALWAAFLWVLLR